VTIWQHLFPPFDAWWPNIIAQVAWTVPALTVHHLLLRRHFKHQLAEKLHEFMGHETTP
jgi:hypothetical protein